MILANSVPLIHSSLVLLPTGFHHKTLQGFTQFTPSKGTQTIWKAGEWNEELESDVWSERPPENSAKHDDKGQSYNSVCGRLSVQPLDFTVLSETAATPVTHMETTETLYKLSYIVCVKTDYSESHQLFISLSARERVCRHEESESQSVHSRSFQSSAVHGRCIEIRRCAQHCLCLNQLYNYREDILEFEEGNVILLLNVLQHIYQWSRHYCGGSWDSWVDRNYSRSKHSVSGFQVEERGGSKEGFFNYQANKYGKQCRQTFLGIKGIWA